MADAKICDRCGTVYAPDLTKFENERYTIFDAARENRGCSYHGKDVGQLIDLCPACSEMLRLWMISQFRGAEPERGEEDNNELHN